jgi:bisphosphoglycerate-independent phosphoglycerate mutase (AlkP superfamily)
LNAAHRFDSFVKRLWEMTQEMPEYRDQTTFIITADHGRGSGLEDWKHHNAKTPGSESDWIAVIGPDTLALGAREKTKPYVIAQIAATIGALVGEDFHSAFPRSGGPIDELIGRANK